VQAMILEGKYDFAASQRDLWDFLIDPARIAKCLPDLKSFEVEGEDKFVAIVRVGVGFIKSDFKFKAEIAGKEPIKRLTLKAAGSGSGSNISLDMNIELREISGGTQLSYSSDVKVGGIIASLAQRVIKDSAEKNLAGVFGCIKEQVG